MLPGLSMDSVVITRQSTSEDLEGNPTGDLAAQWSGQATWGSASASDRQVAAQRGQELDAYVSGIPVGTDVAPGDIATVRDATWIVTDVYDVRLHLRLALRRTTE